MSSLRKLLDAVLEVEPWNPERHTSKVGTAWAECGRRATGYPREGERSKPSLLVQQQVFRLGRQLNDPTAKTPWKSYPEVMRRVEEIVGKMAATRRYRDKFGLPQQQGAVEPRISNLATVETPQTNPDQPATAQQRQRQGAVEPSKSYVAMVETAQTSPEQPATVQQRQQQVPVVPGTSYELHLALRSYVATTGRTSPTATTF